MFDKYLYALGRGVRGAKKALDQAAAIPDPAEAARDITPPPQPAPVGRSLPRSPLVLGLRPLVMGIVNVTPDSFSDGGLFLDHQAAIAHGLALLEEGADILDIGGESTRPGHEPVSADEEIARVVPVIAALAARTSLPISIDTMKARVAQAALDAGASIINDVWGFQHDPALARVAAERGVPAVIMHNRLEDDPTIDVMEEILAFLSRSIEIGLAAGMRHDQFIVDPGFGFGKTHAQSLTTVRDLARLKALGCPILLGVSRKRAIGLATGRSEPKERAAGSVAAHLMGAMQGAQIVRVHDVAAHVDAMKVFAAVMDPARVEMRA